MSRSAFASLITLLFKIDQETTYDQVCSSLKTLLIDYPHSPLFHWIASIVSWKLSQLDDAVFFIDRALSACSVKLAKQAAFLIYEQGLFHYLKLEFEQSLFRFNEVLKDCLDLDIQVNNNTDKRGSD